MKCSASARAFTIVELLVVVSIIGLLISILLPAVGKARDGARLTISQTNLRQLGQAHATYAGEWGDRQFTLVDDNISRYGVNATAANGGYQNQTGEWHPGILLGWAEVNGTGGLWGFYFETSGNETLLQPIDFNSGFGWFRLPNAKQFNQYLSGRFYDPVFYAPKDRLVWSTLEPHLDAPGEYVPSQVIGHFVWSSYCLSPAALFSPDVMANADLGGFTNPWTLNAGFRVPSASQARYSDLKTHMLEHHWLQQSRADCNPNFTNGTYDGCEPYYFNHGWESVPVTLFYDGHVEGLGVREAENADTRIRQQTQWSQHGVWSRDTPMGSSGYFSNAAYDWSQTSFHILTTDGIRGRDKIGG